LEKASAKTVERCPKASFPSTARNRTVAPLVLLAELSCEGALKQKTALFEKITLVDGVPDFLTFPGSRGLL
jgi:hypothetical protein